ncbi:hypothetical protein GUITHDRAFT_78784, partial [Guillardia theta CCMP2712]
MADREVEELSKQFPKFKSFATEVENCLSLFERSKEWSDYVSALSRLIKVLQRHDFNDVGKMGSLSVIPDKALVARRLAQCTNSILPSGVHRKALDAYRVLLTRIGPSQLAVDLVLWSSGLFSLFPHANTECKNIQLRLIVDFYIPLGMNLVPCLEGLVMSLLPGIEDEAAAFYSDTAACLDLVKHATSTEHFFKALWWLLGSSANVRLPLL